MIELRALTATLLLVIAATPALAAKTESRRPRLLPLAPTPQDVEILYGHPEAVGQPFVLRVRELPGAAPKR